MKSKNVLCGLAIAVVLQLGMLAGSAQTNIYLFSGSKTNITLNPGTYIITAYGATGGSYYGSCGRLAVGNAGRFCPDQHIPVQRVEDEYHSEPGHLHHHGLRRYGRLLLRVLRSSCSWECWPVLPRPTYTCSAGRRRISLCRPALTSSRPTALRAATARSMAASEP